MLCAVLPEQLVRLGPNWLILSFSSAARVDSQRYNFTPLFRINAPNCAIAQATWCKKRGRTSKLRFYRRSVCAQRPFFDKFFDFGGGYSGRTASMSLVNASVYCTSTKLTILQWRILNSDVPDITLSQFFQERLLPLLDRRTCELQKVYVGIRREKTHSMKLMSICV